MASSDADARPNAEVASRPSAAVVRGYRVRSGGQSCCHSLSIALVSSLNALAILFFVKSAFAFGDDDYVDHTIERCSGGSFRDGKFIWQ